MAIHFKGSGFYTTDYGRGSKKARAAADNGAKAADEPKATKATSDGDGAKKSEGGGRRRRRRRAARPLTRPARSAGRRGGT